MYPHEMWAHPSRMLNTPAQAPPYDEETPTWLVGFVEEVKN